MTILIKGMEMPTDPLYPIHVTIYADGTVITGHGVGEFAKEAVPVPTPHGRLGDLGALDFGTVRGGGVFGVMYANLDDIARIIKDAPTVIEAEEG